MALKVSDKRQIRDINYAGVEIGEKRLAVERRLFGSGPNNNCHQT